ncbi:Core-2/I-Branching enzyme [Andreprevotia lacus DSM 23236]|uniref:Peptide O-xylosyltransferase n=1 Tax=Andreprevotia lacus DSM 23236 TaxID=1121001 RepID=A0A1W1XYJ3_9NEIS|nr:beta-1,6-N-acetylglucosaminyltransferase [Andreprevotia lacus]SMC28986.1 Core-2/I-Branching enzyme [Andreprevotia lacus DSM 23236]
MRIAYLILAHDQPAQLGRLVARLLAPGVSFHLHIDANTPDGKFAAMQAAMPADADVCFVARQRCRWGGFSLVAATLALLESALARDADWLVLLSGQDYPLKSHAAIVARLAADDVAAHIDSRSAAEFDVRYRWQAWHFEFFNRHPFNRVWQKLQRVANKLGLVRRLPAPLREMRAGSQWWCMRADAARAVQAFVAANPQVIRFFRTTLVPDEAFFQTVLAHALRADQIQTDNLRYLQWQPGAWSPRTFDDGDLPALQASPALFARKFAPDGELSARLDAALASAGASR